MVLKDRLARLNDGWTPREHIKLLPHTFDLNRLWKNAVKEQWEGIVIKDPDSMYLHHRSDQWLKVKFHHIMHVLLVSYRDNDKGLIALTHDGIAVHFWGNLANEVRLSINNHGLCIGEASYFTEGKNGILRHVFLTRIVDKAVTFAAA